MCTPVVKELGCIDVDVLNVFTQPDALIRNLFYVALAVAGLIFFAMLLLGGFRYLTAGGDEKAAAEGQKTLTRAFIGLIIVIAAVLILQLVVSIFGLRGVTVTPGGTITPP